MILFAKRDGDKISIWCKDPGDLIWFQFNFAPFFANSVQPTETIASHTVTYTPGTSGSSLVQHLATSTAVNFQVTGGTNGTSALVQCSATTTAGNTYFDEKTIYITTRVEVP